METPASQSFTSFIVSLLKRAKLGKENTLKFVSEENIKIYEKAFTHRSVSEDENYELLEFVGDGFVNTCVASYIRKWDPHIVSVKYLTRLKHNIMSKKSLAIMAEKSGFYEWIKITPELRAKFALLDINYKHKNHEYMSILEDVFEAFIGATKEIADEVYTFGVGFQVCYKIIASFMDELHISLDYKDLFDAKTRYKEFCDKRGWDFCHTITTREEYVQDKKRYFVEVYGFPLGDQKKDPQNRELLGFSNNTLKMDAQNEACEMALTLLKDKYRMFDIPPDPYAKN